MHAPVLPRLRFSSGLHSPRSPLTNVEPTTTSPSSTTLSHPSLFALADSPPPLASTALPNPRSRLSTHFTPASSSFPPLPGFVHGELAPALGAPQATTRRDFGAASSLMCQHVRVNALLLTLVVFFANFDRGSHGSRRSVRIGGCQARGHVCEYAAVCVSTCCSFVQST